MADFYFVHDSNPNDGIGGGGCLASGGQVSTECEGPWINFHRVSTEFHASPYACICAKHLREAADGFEYEEVLSGGDVLPLRETKATPVTQD